LIYVLLPFFRANPDNERLYPRVSRWLLEIETDDGIPTREIGLDEHGNTLLAAPDHRNWGFWTDEPEFPNADWWLEEQPSSEDDFLSRWEEFYGSTDARPFRGNRPFDWPMFVFGLLAASIIWFALRLLS